MSYLKKAWSWLKSLFTSDTIGAIFRIILNNLATKTVSLLKDPVFQKFAYNTAVELHNDDSKTVSDKAKDFNIKMAEFIKSKGLISSDSLVNALRELACQAIKVKIENGEPVEKL